MYKSNFCLLFFLLVAPFNVLADDPIVKISNGQLKGREVKTREGKTYYHFKGVPFAKPPVGKLRFKAPEEADNWNGVLDPNKEVMCIQTGSSKNAAETEDCLLMNVYTPSLPSGSNNPSLPVIVWYFGGGFVGGSNGEYWGYGPELLIAHDVILVVPNYRVGPFGFLSMHNEVLPGNYGLKDQHLALKWVQKNIAAFGGDPQKVTIMGQSAGGASVGYQLLYPKNAGLFRAAVLMSGTSIKPGSYQRRALDIAKKGLNFLDSNFLAGDPSPQKILEFLQSQDTSKLKEMSYSVGNYNASNEAALKGFTWAPVIETVHDTAFITQNMYELVQSGNYNRVPVIMGVASEEMLPHSQSGLDNDIKTAKEWDNHPEYLVPDGMHIPDNQKASVGKNIKDIYVADKWANHPEKAVMYWSDMGYTVAQIQHAELARNFHDVWFYQFSYDGDLGGNSFRFSDGQPLVSHAEDTRYLFANKNQDLSQYPESDRLTSKRMTTMWTNFAKYLDPTPSGTDLLVKWPKVSKDETPITFLNIFNDLIVAKGPKESTYRPWTKLRTNLAKGPFDTYP